MKCTTAPAPGPRRASAQRPGARLRKGLLLGLVMGMAAGLTNSAAAADYCDPDWPCIQRKTPHLSVVHLWSGPAIGDESLTNWRATPEVAALAPALAAQRTSMEDAETLIGEFAARATAEGAATIRLPLLFAGVFVSIERERAAIIEGIARYARKQADLAARIETMRVALTEAGAAANPDLDRVEELEDNIKWEERIYADRAQSLTYVCEAPVILEQRVFAIARMIMSHLE